MSVEWCRRKKASKKRKRNSLLLSSPLHSLLSSRSLLTQVPVLRIEEQGLEAGHLEEKKKQGKGEILFCCVFFVFFSTPFEKGSLARSSNENDFTFTLSSFFPSFTSTIPSLHFPSIRHAAPRSDARPRRQLERSRREGFVLWRGCCGRSGGGDEQRQRQVRRRRRRRWH